ncbi:N-acetyl sugar amidotransferase [Candidatus Micrarchaeota archaeon]|nr:N-acetyl sugar amidotransferase [Candidatus Micrarchaeota archaeon]
MVGPNEVRRCSKCLLPETQETITYDNQGVCNVCKQHEYKNESIDWVKREKELRELIEEYRGRYQYDCIIPYSGGKDSTYTVYKLVRDYNVKPLVVSFDHGFYRPQTMANTKSVMKQLGVDYHLFTPNWKVVKKLMAESLRRKGDFCWHCHTGIFSYPMQVAVKFKIPLLFWGEPSAEYTSYYRYDEKEEVDEKRFNRFINLGITADDMVGMIEGVDMRDLEPFRYPALKDLKAINYRSVCLGSYIPWDPKKNSEIIKRELGWKGAPVEGVPPEYDYEKVECMVQGVRDYLKYVKRGFGRTAHLASLDLRNGRITPEKAQELIDKYDGKRPASLDLLLHYLDMSEEEFEKIAMSHVVAPHKHDPKKIKKGEPLPDMPQWDRTK